MSKPAKRFRLPGSPRPGREYRSYEASRVYRNQLSVFRWQRGPRCSPKRTGMNISEAESACLERSPSFSIHICDRVLLVLRPFFSSAIGPFVGVFFFSANSRDGGARVRLRRRRGQTQLEAKKEKRRKRINGPAAAAHDRHSACEITSAFSSWTDAISTPHPHSLCLYACIRTDRLNRDDISLA